MRTTQTGILIALCGECYVEHPVNRAHCADCGIASAFISDLGLCLTCGPSVRKPRA